MARLLRAVSGMSQKQFSKAAGVHPSRVVRVERGLEVPSREHLERMAQTVGLTVPAAEELLRVIEALRKPRRRRGAGVEALLAGITEGVRSQVENAYRRLLTLPLPESRPRAEDRIKGLELFKRLAGLPEKLWQAVVREAEEFQGWSVCEQACEASIRESSRELERAVAWARLAGEIAERVRGPEEWRHRVQGYAAAHRANVLRVSGDLKAADAVMEEAKRLWLAGSDAAGVLDPGRLLALEASLRRAQRRFPEALALLDEAAAVGRSPERTLIQKGSTLEVMSEYEAAVETLLRAVPLIRQKGDRHLEAILSCNLALNYSHLGRFAEGAELADRAREVATETGDEIGILRVTWTQGRIAAGLGRTGEARSLLSQARREFAVRRMDYDVALALLEEAALLLAEGRAAEVQVLACELAVVFESKGVHEEALRALRLFQKAVEREEATAELARRVLGYLFRARHDPGLRFVS